MSSLHKPPRRTCFYTSSSYRGIGLRLQSHPQSPRTARNSCPSLEERPPPLVQLRRRAVGVTFGETRVADNLVGRVVPCRPGMMGKQGGVTCLITRTPLNERSLLVCPTKVRGESKVRQGGVNVGEPQPTGSSGRVVMQCRGPW